MIEILETFPWMAVLFEVAISPVSPSWFLRHVR